jgi:hypothetical protein
VTFVSLSSLSVTNQCVLVCDLQKWTDSESLVWQVLRGTQDEVGRSLAAILDDIGVIRIDDFGGVCKTFLCAGDEYVETPPRTKGKAAVFSFTPKNRIMAEGSEMARVSSTSGFDLLILTVQKHEKFGKVWVLCGALRHLSSSNLTYYEDTDSVVDELKSSPESSKVNVVHVQAPGYEHYISRLADRVISQSQYQKEVLE